MTPAPSSTPPAAAPFAVVGRYAIFDEIASGGMASVHLGRLLGAAGFSRTVAIKRLHAQFAKDPEFAAMFLDEARLCARISHPHVAQTIDVVPADQELLLVMEYVHGAPFASLLGAARRAGFRVPPRIIAGVMVGVLEGLHAAHEAKNERGAPLGVVHRDVSPQNVLVGADGVPRVIDFGVAKAVGKMHATRDGQLKGKLAYMSPEQVKGGDISRRSDIFSAAVVLWEALMAERLFDGDNPAETILQVLSRPIRPVREKHPDLPEALEAVVQRGADRDPALRFATARDMAAALEGALPVAPAREIAAWVQASAGPMLAAREQILERIEHVVAAPPTAGERTRIEGLRASLGDGLFLADAPREAESGPRPIAGALRSDDLGQPAGGSSAGGDDPLVFEPTQPQKARSEPPAAAPVLPVAPRSGPRSPRSAPPGAAVPSPAAPAPPPAAARAEPADATPTTEPSAGDRAPSAPARPVGSLEAPARRADGRGHRIPVRAALDAEDPRHSLRARLAAPIGLLVLGVLLSLVDFALRQMEIALPVRPIWAAEVLVVVGVIWAFVRVAIAPRD